MRAPLIPNNEGSNPADILGLDEEQETDIDWLGINNLDKFFLTLYSYYLEKGFWPMVASRTSDIIIIAFTMFFSTFLFLFVNWSEVLKCTTEEACKNVDGYRSDVLSNPTFGDVMIIFYFVIFSLYLVWNGIVFVYSLYEMREASHFYRKKLGITDRQLSVIGWHEVVDKIVEVQDDVRLCHGHQLDALDITNRIMRKENYFLAMINRDIIDFSSPCGMSDFFTLMHAFERPGTHEVKPYVGEILEWNVRWCILEWMFNDKFEITSEFENAEKMKQRFLYVGIINLCIMPFALLFRCIFFFLAHGERLQNKRAIEIMSKPMTKLTRAWTPYAHLRLREFNEMSHQFNQRLSLTHCAADDYLSHCEWVLSSIIGRLFAYISGAIVGVLLLLTLVDSNVLLYFELCGRGLVWYLTVFSAILVVSRSMINEKPSTTRDAKEAMTKVLSHAHYLPKSWIKNAHLPSIQQEFQSLYQTRVLIVINELINVIFTPFILMFTMPECVDDIIKFARESKLHVEGVGDICKFAQLRLEEGDINYQPHVEEELAKSYNHPSTVLNEGKLEKSMITFAINHPRWQTDPLQTDLLTHIAEPQDNEQEQSFINLQRSHMGPLEDSPMNMSFSTLLGTFKRNNSDSVIHDSMFEDLNGINLLEEGSIKNNLRDVTKKLMQSCSYMFENLEKSQRMPQHRGFERIHVEALPSIRELQNEVDLNQPSARESELRQEDLNQLHKQRVEIEPEEHKRTPQNSAYFEQNYSSNQSENPLERNALLQKEDPTKLVQNVETEPQDLGDDEDFFVPVRDPPQIEHPTGQLFEMLGNQDLQSVPIREEHEFDSSDLDEI